MVEQFGEYRRRWPPELNAFPECLIESWVYRHWAQFRIEWMPQGVTCLISSDHSFLENGLGLGA